MSTSSTPSEAKTLFGPKVASKARVVIEIEDPNNYRPQLASIADWKESAQKIRDQIIRHVDGVSLGSVSIEITEACHFCGRPWELDDQTGEPVCCDQLTEEWKGTNPHAK